MRIFKIGITGSMLALLMPLLAVAQAPPHTLGRILLQVEKMGEAWYILPDSGEKVYFPNGTAAYDIMRSYGLGISNADLSKIPVGLMPDDIVGEDGDGDGLGDKLEEALGTNFGDTDSDDDGFSDKTEIENGYDPLGPGRPVIDMRLADRLKGKILLQVESRGEAWYVHPEDGKRYYMKDGETAYVAMRRFSLGANDQVIEGIPTVERQIGCEDDLECFILAAENDQPAEVDWKTDEELFIGGAFADWHRKLEIERTNGEYRFTERTESIEYYMPEDVRQELISEGTRTAEEIDSQLLSLNEQAYILEQTYNECTYGSDSRIVEALRKWQRGDIEVGISFSFGSDSELSGDYDLIGECIQKGAPGVQVPEGCTASENEEGQTVISCQGN